ncbi:GDNF-inducible zinc finger protein 1 isoform X2 [Danaus plexippus]|uniref:Zinc finger protein 111 n=1 Tax=Danaus plexippus plexippus TaxID=278856 RepID=A0A212FH87_DANPL|nr:GDNF-inducible zinc finger protein 1 isoform X1 [Danaus plexippus]XP_061384010.1 GDNF-inducible zinc finger protein 1 isoform X2 [Danaus plexippus]OWR53094.1 zinc finger protein 111 [Danaus plexippus plexippus]
MNTQVCVNCYNKKAVNSTDNRLVTESCGHVKCMDCLLQEKSGCVACKQNVSEPETIESSEQNPPLTPVESYEEPAACEDASNEDNANIVDPNSKKKLEISHIRIEMDGDRKCYTCTVCKKKFYARSQVSYHAYCNGQKKPYNCQLCKQSFASLSHYKYHTRVHSQERSYGCDVCGAGFYQMSKLKRHKLKHTKEKNFSCSECNKAFNNMSSLRKHARTHTEERPYSCNTCGRRFRDSSNYKKHVDKHKKPCKSCGMELQASGVHRCEGPGSGSPGGRGNGGGPTTGGPRAHACPRCRKAFHSRKDMRRHAAIHSDSKPFRCKACPDERRFRRKDNLERHIRNAHPNCAPATALECDLTALQSVAHHAYEIHEKIRLEILNPLPPLPQEVIQKHIDVEVVDKKSIIEANNARESVIVEKKPEEKKVVTPENEYVHKIRKAIIPLPPIDQEKFRSVQRGLLPDSVAAAPIKNMEIYKKILYEKIEKDSAEVIQNPKMHWRRKMEQDSN